MLEPDSEARGLATSDAQRSSIDEAPRRSEPSVFFLGSGLMFMFGALLFFGIAAYQLATFDRHPSAALYQLMSHPSRGVDTSGPISDREKMDIVEALTLTFIDPLLEITCAIVCAVIGVHDELKGQVPLGFLVLKAGVRKVRAEIAAEAVQLVRDRIGPVASFKTALVVERLPKTRSGKILRQTMRKIADGEEYKMPATIDDPTILGEIKEGLKAAGFI